MSDTEIDLLKEDLAIQIKQVELWEIVTENKDAEIERLKEYNANQLALLEENQREIERLSRIAKSQYALITELCDALDAPRFDAISQRELVTRAREETR